MQRQRKREAMYKPSDLNNSSEPIVDGKLHEDRDSLTDAKNREYASQEQALQPQRVGSKAHNGKEDMETKKLSQQRKSKERKLTSSSSISVASGGTLLSGNIKSDEKSFLCGKLGHERKNCPSKRR